MEAMVRRGCLYMILALVALAPGCARKPQPVVVPPTVTETKPAETVRPPEPVKPTESTAALALGDVFFDFDKYNLRDDGLSTLNEDGKFLGGNPTVNLTLEGHCDERGTVEYNLALGEKRANAVKSYLVQYGVDPGRLATISYGKEKPFDPGHNEAAWAKNRRVHFVKK
jgi:peptidoglycan-associated lipoprotein